MNTNDNNLNKYDSDWYIKSEILSWTPSSTTGARDDLKLNSISSNVEENIFLI
jgi:hypothetical protein